MCQWCYILHSQVLGPQPIVLQGEHGSGSYPRTISPLYCILSRCSCRYKTKMDKRSGFWQVDLTPNAQEPSSTDSSPAVVSFSPW